MRRVDGDGHGIQVLEAVFAATAPTRKMMVRCKKCGNEYATHAIGMDEATFKNPTNVIRNVRETCPICGKESAYDKQDYFFK